MQGILKSFWAKATSKIRPKMSGTAESNVPTTTATTKTVEVIAKKDADPPVRFVDRAIGYFDSVEETLWSGPFSFICGSDTQFGMMDMNECIEWDAIKWDREIALTRQAIEAANKMTPRPRFFVVCGDLIDAHPGNPYRPYQMRDFKKTFTELDNEIPLICVCGNHDVGDEPTVETISSYRSDIGKDYYSFVCGGCLFIIINSQYYENRTQVAELGREADEWLDDTLTKVKSYKHAVVFQHIPWFLKKPNEPNQYFNIDEPLRSQMLAKFYEAGVKTIFCGHFHRNAGGFYKEMELVITTAIGHQLGKDTHGARVVRVLDDKIHHKFYPLADMPKQVQL